MKNKIEIENLKRKIKIKDTEKRNKQNCLHSQFNQSIAQTFIQNLEMLLYQHQQAPDLLILNK